LVYDNDYVNRCEAVVPTCSACGGILKPDVVLFGENIKNYAEARDMIQRAQAVVVIGSSLTVYPRGRLCEGLFRFLSGPDHY